MVADIKIREINAVAITRLCGLIMVGDKSRMFIDQQ